MRAMEVHASAFGPARHGSLRLTTASAPSAGCESFAKSAGSFARHSLRTRPGDRVALEALAADDRGVTGEHTISSRARRLTRAFDGAVASAQYWGAARLTRDADPETGLPTRTRLLADVATIPPGVPARIELLLVGAAAELSASGALGGDPELPRRIAQVLRRAARSSGARAYRLDASLYAILGPFEIGSVPPGAAAHSGLAEISEAVAAAAVRGEARLPDEAGDGTEALRVAHDRLRTRSRWQRLSSERQVRDVLLQLLSERRAGGAAVVLPRVAAHAVGIARRLGLSMSELDEIVRASELQDLGMLTVPEAITGKRGALSEDEWQQIRAHPEAGERVLAASPAMVPVARLVRSCYERYDGTGYPDGLSGEAIPLGARIIAVCVAFDAMTSARPYREALPAPTAFAELKRCAGLQFDPVVVAAFCVENQLEPGLELAAASS